jgi:hypothetical protein
MTDFKIGNNVVPQERDVSKYAAADSVVMPHIESPTRPIPTPDRVELDGAQSA